MARLTGAALFVLAAASVAADDPFAAEYRKAEGTWVVTEMVMNGDAIPAEGFKDLRLVLKGRTVTAYSGKNEIAAGTYAIVSAKGKRVAFDLTMAVGPDKGKTFPALNEWADADTIRSCLAQPGQPRPTGVTTEQGDRRAVFVIKRTKE